jgi:DNA-binding transcriptional ArsR family regulator
VLIKKQIAKINLANEVLFVYLRTEMKTKSIYSDQQIKLARFAKALSNPVRIYILELLSKQSCCYSGDLTDILPIAKSTLSQHLKELKDAGLIQGEIEAPKIKYCINKENWEFARIRFKELFN